MAIEKLYHAPDPGTSSLQGPFRGDVVEQLRIRMKATQEKLEESEAALNRCREYSARDIEIISRQRAKIIELEDLVQKQKATISNQSKAIADPKTMRVRQPAIPMPIFPLTPTQQGSCVRSPGSSTPSSVRSPYPSSVFDLPPPTFDMPISIPQGKSTSLAEISKMSPNSRSNLSKSNCSLCPSLNTKTAIVVISDRLQSLFARTQLFAHTYTNFPSIHLDSQLNPKVKEYVMSISDKLHASTLLGNPCTRFCVVTKAINFYLVHDILQLTVVKGFDAHMNLEVKQMQDFLTQGMLNRP
ncbi:hypothetical protein BDV28DRAFT_129100 [Aspergillus coremiiformis]|uniref:Uncharacterized protein n=1 Tax=Aspergillus coremiiformis TaxID=138285 RepID=A0A5N6ZCY0_9EURO|nr:hypothetical protein BDV28DRAFT_129100 [Aspergillus coremiiformis]